MFAAVKEFNVCVIAILTTIGAILGAIQREVEKDLDPKDDK